jgi:hypothetical protein
MMRIATILFALAMAYAPAESHAAADKRPRVRRKKIDKAKAKYEKRKLQFGRAMKAVERSRGRGSFLGNAALARATVREGKLNRAYNRAQELVVTRQIQKLAKDRKNGKGDDRQLGLMLSVEAYLVQRQNVDVAQERYGEATHAKLLMEKNSERPNKVAAAELEAELSAARASLGANEAEVRKLRKQMNGRYGADAVKEILGQLNAVIPPPASSYPDKGNKYRVGSRRRADRSRW